MITIYKEIDGKLMSFSDQDHLEEHYVPDVWINMVAPTIQEVKNVAEKTGLSYAYLFQALDEEESAHVDIEDNDMLIVLDASYLETKEDGSIFFSTLPFSIIFNQNYIVTVSPIKVGLVDSLLQKNKKIEPQKRVRLTLNIIMRLASDFIISLKKIDAKTKDIERILHNSQKNKELFDLMELNKSLVYFSTALNSDKVLIAKLVRLPEFKKNEEDFDLIEDVSVEIHQAIEMCSIYRDILAGTMDAFASIISNNLNIVMKALAVITIIISIPTLIASIYGMNVMNLPLADQPSGFIFVLILSLVCSILGAIGLFLYTRKIKRY
ncbi:MAG: magnesium transporter CorA family protein [Candidatus Izemoplasmatales bacterium]|jgi:magnesium transporter|nr:magnesium transporter CorA family protein [Candidatus Izemoplasmatales bacterium]